VEGLFSVELGTLPPRESAENPTTGPGDGREAA
jgi:putative (di)nucleoside polyphosphate hydrolase